MGDKKYYVYGGYITPSYKREIRDVITDRIDQSDYTDKVINSALYKILGRPGSKLAPSKPSNSMSTSGMGTSAYTSAQTYSGGEIEAATKKSDSGVGMSWLDTAIASVVNIGRDLLGYYHADKAAKVAYERQEESYNAHFSMPAKVAEYEEAGLNPMALTGAGTGANSTPNVSQGDTPSLGDMGSILGALLNYKTRKAEIDVMRQDVASKIEYRAVQKVYQEKINEWFETNQVVSIEKMQAETADALQRVQTGKAQEALNNAGITQAQAEATLKFAEALQKQWENTPAFRNATLKLMDAQSAQSFANAQHAYEDIKNLAEQRANIAADTLLKYAQTDVGKQQLINMGYEADKLAFDVKYQKADRVWNNVERCFGMLKDAGVGVAGLASPFTGGLSGAGLGSFTQTSQRVTDGAGKTTTTETFTTHRPVTFKESKSQTYKLK